MLTGFAALSHAQLSEDARTKILYAMIATEGAARIPMPLGGEGIDLYDTGQIDAEKLKKELQKNGSAITAGHIVNITAIEFSDKTIEIELDGGGTKKKSFLSRIQVGIGNASTSQPAQAEEQAKGSKIVLKFASRIQPGLTPEQLKDLLNPLLDFNKQSLARTGVDALPPEFKEAVLAKRAMIGMDRNTVLLALGRPHETQRERERNTGVMLEDWLYRGRGDRVTFVTFDGDSVVSIREY
jgi:hypothetical protein